MRAAAALGRPVFLDLKLHDIPNTVEGAARSAAASGASLLTVHASGGAEMVRAAVRGAGPGVRVLAVTVLTSLDAAALDGDRPRAGRPRTRWSGSRSSRSAPAQAASSARRTRSPRCAPRSGPGPLLVIPGVRPAGAAKGDQARVATPAEAVRAGADVLVIGRPLREGGDPAAAARAIAGTL